MQHTSIPVTVIGGYLGSGKTTLLNALLRGARGVRLAVLVNDFGSINIDAELIIAHQGDTISLANGCICCSRQDNLGAAFGALSERSDPPDQIVIEASGVADPRRIARYAQSMPGLRLDGILVLVDAEQIRRQVRDKYVGDTVLDQLHAADLLILSKTDLISPATAEEVRAWLMVQAPAAHLIEAVAGQLPVEFVLGDLHHGGNLALDGDLGSGEHGADHGGHDAQHDLTFEQVSFTTAEPLERAALTVALDALPPAVVRGKGVLYLADEPARRVILQMVGRRWNLRPGEPWGDAAPASRLVFIGPRDQIDPAAVLAGLGVSSS